MPIYEYECRACGKQLEMFQKITEEPLKLCPACGKEALQKLISSTSFQLKGTGWYVTDIRDKGKPKPGEQASNDEGSTKKTENDTKASTTTEKSETQKTDSKSSDTKGKGETKSSSSSKSEAQ